MHSVNFFFLTHSYTLARKREHTDTHTHTHAVTHNLNRQQTETWGGGFKTPARNKKHGRSIVLEKEMSWGLIWRSPERVSVGDEGAGVSLLGAVTTIIFVATKVLSQQSHFPNKHRTKLWLSRQTFCRNKHTIVATKDMFCRDERVFVAAKVCLSRQNYVCCHIFATHICRDKIMFVTTNTYLCRDKNGTCGSSHQWHLSFHVSKHGA